MQNKRVIKTTLDGIPVELTINKLGPSSPPNIKNVAHNLSSEDQNLIQVNIENKKSLSSNQIKQAEGAIGSLKEQFQGNEEIFEHLLELYDATNNLPKDKEWWESKTIWVNITALIAIAGSFFGLNLNIPPETLVALAGIIMPLLNIWLRKVSSSKIKPIPKPRIMKKK